MLFSSIQVATTRNIRVSVEAIYQPQYSNPLINEFVHAYRVRIENLSKQAVQLLSRHWYIWDSNGFWREVEGEGVVGEQPIIPVQAEHSYVSGCHLRTEFGRMHGTYKFQRKNDKEIFEVIIPRFELIVPFKYN